MFLAALLLVPGLLLSCGAASLDAASLEAVEANEGRVGGRDLTAKSLYDSRFAKGELSNAERTTALKGLVQAYLTTFNELGIETWLANSTLLGWWWGKHMLPWEVGVHMRVSEPSIFFLAAYYNMSSFSVKNRDTWKRRSFLLELSPYAKDAEQAKQQHAADARWIDTVTGLSIDVYAVRYALTHPKGEGVVSSNDGSELMDTYLFPLRKTTFEDVEVRIPYRYQELLVMEYGDEALNKTEQNDHHFDAEKNQWVLNEEPRHSESGGSQTTGNGIENAEL